MHAITMLKNEAKFEVEDKVLQVLKQIDTVISNDTIGVVHRSRKTSSYSKQKIL